MFKMLYKKWRFKVFNMKFWNLFNFLKNFCVVVFKENVYYFVVKML